MSSRENRITNDKPLSSPRTPQEEALLKFGPRKQLLALAEELSEASAAVSRLLNAKGDKAALRDEIVDVQSVVASLDTWLGSDDEWREARKKKENKLRQVLDRHGDIHYAGGWEL